MTGTPRSATAAAVLVTVAAVLLLTGCGSSGGAKHGATAGARPPASVSGTPAPGASASASAGTSTNAPAGTAATTPAPDDSEAPGSAADAPKVPDAQLTAPGGGNFTKKQKTYLSGRVPKGTDPVAVLEGGQEICDRLARTARVDKDAAASAIISGDISRAGAAAAVAALCPDQQPVIDAAAHGFGDGTFAVSARPVAGVSVAPGRYRAPHPSPSCNWRVTGAGGTTLTSGTSARLTVPAAARGITSSGCYAWLASGGT